MRRSSIAPVGLVLLALASLDSRTIERVQAAPPDEPRWSDAQKTHWSYLPPLRPDLPAVKDRAWVRNPVDAFILAQIEEMTLAPAPEADKATLVRRLRFDLTGLPPTPEEVDAFLADKRPDAYERLVDRLLDTPQYGERWARMWLDLARYAESDGFKSDKTRPNAYRYRDWVIRALNADLPYDRFVTLQIAGDEVAPFDPDAIIATGFNRHWPFEDNGTVPGLNRQLMLDDVTDTTSSVFLGMTLACARCHNHKFDPISQADYYRFQALFAATAARDDASLASPLGQAFNASVAAERKVRLDPVESDLHAVEHPYALAILKADLAKLPAEVRRAFDTDPADRTADQDDLLRRYPKQTTVPPAAMTSALTVKPADLRLWTALSAEKTTLAAIAAPSPEVASGMADAGPKAPPVFLLHKGNLTLPGREIAPGFPSIFDGVLPDFAAAPNDSTTGRRAALAAWLTRPEHPLTARVMVNRLWQNHFGRGLSPTPSDLGAQGTEPTHPELLDWLASEFVSKGWSMKALHRLMVTSAAYRQSSTPSPRALAEDPDNTLFTRASRRRLEGEAVRDAILAVSGRLDSRLGGPSVFPDLPPGIGTKASWSRSPSAADRSRRSIYVFVRRNLKYPLFDAFDAPDTNTTCPERNITVNAPQALMLLNSDLVIDEARALAGRVLTSVDRRREPDSLVNRVYRLSFGRDPLPDELARGVAFLRDQPALLSGRADDPKSIDLPSPMPDGYGPAQGAALVDYCHAILNLNEFVFVD